MRELVTDSFAGGGGASLGIEMALGYSPDIAINHDAEAIAMHAANHPSTRHLSKNIWKVDPLEEIHGQPVGLSWFSPDCKHFSKAKGGKPVARNIRDLAWVVVLWANRVKPRVIMLENVEEFRTWRPLTNDNMPCPNRKGETFNRWHRELRRAGYKVEFEELRACDYGAPTIRKRLFMIARRDGERIEWPEPTHGPGRAYPWEIVADCIDWSIPCPSIFLTREEARALGINRPLAEATMARIAKGVFRYVVEAAEAFIVPVTHSGDLRCHPVSGQFRTITTAARGERALVVPHLQAYYGAGNGGDDRSASVLEPARVIPTENRHALVAAFLAQHNGGMVGHDVRKPASTIVQKGCTQAVVATHLINLKGSDRRGGPMDGQAPSQTAGGRHLGEVRAFLTKYHGEGGQFQPMTDPMHTADTRGRMGLVMVHGEPYQIADIGMRMLTPRELFRAQGFPDSYIIDPVYNGKRLSKTAQIRMCGNSVSPVMAKALVSANYAGEMRSAA